MKLATSPLPYLGLALGLLTGCGRDEAPAPAAEATYTRSVTYLDTASPSRLDSTFKSPVLKPFAWRRGTNFTIFLEPTTDRETVAFGLVRANLPANLVGTYTLKTKLDATKDADFSYRINTPNSPGYASLYDKTIYTPMGSLTITAYDATHQVVSGRFTVELTNVSDPFGPVYQSIKRRCNLALQGTFTNAPIKDIE